jgi:arsenate reductase (glutaredoxin)
MKDTITVYHNPRCSKSRCALDFLKEKGESFEIIDYLKNPLSSAELKEVVRLLGIHPFDLVRKEEEDFKTYFKNKQLSEDEWIEAMIRFPKLIERPIVVRDQRAVVARPTERINELLD